MNTDTPARGTPALPADSARIEIRDGLGAPTLVLVGEFDLAVAPRLRDQLDLFVGRQVVIDMSETTYIDSTTLGVLVAAHRMGAKISIAGAQGLVRKVLDITGLIEPLHVQDR
jgi:anti-anti-sigma factor